MFLNLSKLKRHDRGHRPEEQQAVGEAWSHYGSYAPAQSTTGEMVDQLPRTEMEVGADNLRNYVLNALELMRTRSG